MAYAVQEVTAPTEEPVSLEEAKAHMRVDTSDDDTYIENLITAVRQMLQEDVAWRTFVTTTWRQRFTAFPDNDDPIELPLPPLATVVHVKYYDTDGVQQTWDSGNYNVDTDSEPGRVQPDYGTVWPSTRDEPGGAVEVQFTAGFGAASAVPERYKLAIKCAVAELYEQREETVTRAALKSPAVERLLRSISRRRCV